jgi:hypothetical protein
VAFLGLAYNNSAPENDAAREGFDEGLGLSMVYMLVTPSGEAVARMKARWAY